MTDPIAPSNPPDHVFRARVAAGARNRATVYVGRHSFVAGRPVEFDSEAEIPSCLDYLLGALGADLVNGFRAVARRRRLDLDQVEATVEGRLENPLVHLAVVGETGRPGLARARVKVYVDSLAPEDALRGAFSETVERSPIVSTLRDSVDLSLELSIVV